MAMSRRASDNFSNSLRREDYVFEEPSPRKIPPTPSSPRFRSTQRHAIERMQAALRRTAPNDETLSERGLLTIDEALSEGAAAIVAMSGKLKEQQHELSKLKNECNAAYRAAAVASREELDKERDKTEAAEVRAEEAERSVALRIRDLENGVVQAHEQIAEERRKTATVQNGLEQSEALHTLLKQRVANLREAAKAVCRALPASAEDEALEADRIARVAAGELSAEDAINKSLGPALDQLDEFGLLSKGLERAARMTEQNRQCTAEVTILKSELEAERASSASLRNDLNRMLEVQRANLEEKAALRREVEEAHEARETADEAARRFHALLHYGAMGPGFIVPSSAPSPQQHHASHHHSNATGLKTPAPGFQGLLEQVASSTSPKTGASPRVASPPTVEEIASRPLSPLPAARAAAVAVDGLEAALREASELTALLRN